MSNFPFSLFILGSKVFESRPSEEGEMDSDMDQCVTHCESNQDQTRLTTWTSPSLHFNKNTAIT